MAFFGNPGGQWDTDGNEIDPWDVGIPLADEPHEAPEAVDHDLPSLGDDQ